MDLKVIIQNKLKDAFDPYEISVYDDSHEHIGHIGYKPGGQTHFRIEMKTSKFQGLTRLEMQRKVHSVLKQEIITEIHAIALNLSA